MKTSYHEMMDIELKRRGEDWKKIKSIQIGLHYINVEDMRKKSEKDQLPPITAISFLSVEDMISSPFTNEHGDTHVEPLRVDTEKYIYFSYRVDGMVFITSISKNHPTWMVIHHVGEEV